MIFSFLAIFHVLQWTFLNFPPFSVFLAIFHVLISNLEEQLVTLSTEIGKALIGTSEFTTDVLKISIDKTTKDLEENRSALKKCENEVENSSDMLSKLDFYYSQFISWADEFDKASIERKKMIISQLFSSITVSRGYKIEAVLNTTYQQFFE